MNTRILGTSPTQTRILGIISIQLVFGLLFYVSACGENDRKFFRINYNDELFNWTTYIKSIQNDEGVLVAKSYTIQQNLSHHGIGLYATVDSFRLMGQSIFHIQNGKEKLLVDRIRAYGKSVITKNEKGRYEFGFFPDSLEKKYALMILRSRTMDGFWFIPYPTILIRSPVLEGFTPVSMQSVIDVKKIAGSQYGDGIDTLLSALFLGRDNTMLSHFKDKNREVFVLPHQVGELSIYQKLTIRHYHHNTVEMFLSADSVWFEDEAIYQIALGDTNLVYSTVQKDERRFLRDNTSGGNSTALQHGRLNRSYYTGTYDLKEPDSVMSGPKGEQFLFELDTWSHLLLSPQMGFLIFQNRQKALDAKIDRQPSTILNEMFKSEILSD